MVRCSSSRESGTWWSGSISMAPSSCLTGPEASKPRGLSAAGFDRSGSQAAVRSLGHRGRLLQGDTQWFQGRRYQQFERWRDRFCGRFGRRPGAARKGRILHHRSERRLLDAFSKALVTAVLELWRRTTLYERGLGRVRKTTRRFWPLISRRFCRAARDRSKSTIACFKAFDVVRRSRWQPVSADHLGGTANELAFRFARRGKACSNGCRCCVMEISPRRSAGDRKLSRDRQSDRTQLADGAPSGAFRSASSDRRVPEVVRRQIHRPQSRRRQHPRDRRQRRAVLLSADLTREFHSARDETLRGKIPLLFFDEFDTAFQTSRGDGCVSSSKGGRRLTGLFPEQIR